MTNIFDDKNEIKSTRVSWGKVGDHIFGTLIGKRAVPDQYNPGEEVPVYEIKAEGGSFHEIVKKVVAEAATEIGKDEIWAVFGRGPLAQQMNRIKIGQKIGMKFTEERETKKGNDQKIIKVFTTGEMDQEWIESQEVTAGDL